MHPNKQLLEQLLAACPSSRGLVSPSSFWQCSALSRALAPNNPGGAAAPLSGGTLTTGAVPSSWSLGGSH